MLSRRATLLTSLALIPTHGRADDPPVTVTLGTATPGGGFPVYGEALVRAVASVDPGLVVEARNTAGSAQNIPLLRAGTIDIGLVQGEPAHEALAVRGGTALTVVAAIYPTPGFFAVGAADPARRIEDLRGRRVALGARGSGLTVMGRAVLQALGLDREVEAVLLDRVGDGPAMVRDGRVAALWGGGSGWPGFTALASGPGGARFLAPDEAAIGRILATNPQMRRVTLPAGSYPGQDRDLVSVGSWSFVLARPGLPDEVGFRLARALDRGGAMLARDLPQGRDTTPANTAAVSPAGTLHPGVARYLREQGHLRP